MMPRGHDALMPRTDPLLEEGLFPRMGSKLKNQLKNH